MRHQFNILIASILGLSVCSLSANDLQADAQRQRLEVERILGPLQLTSELSPGSMQVLLDEAEAQYRLGRQDQALEGFAAILALSPRMSKAWLRIGNLHHQSGQDSEAIVAYQKAATFSGPSEDERANRDKALLNISMLYLDKAGSALGLLELAALDQITRSANEVTDKDREQVHRQLEIRQRAQDLEVRARSQMNRIRSTPKQTKVSFELTKP
jgi:tetratricopeptide (TPR) repeat protein